MSLFVYLREHYVIDVLAGVVYATTAYFVVYRQKMILRLVGKIAFSGRQLVTKALTFKDIEVGT